MINSTNKNYIVLLLFVLLGSYNPGFAQEVEGPFTVTPTYPKPGEPVTISYDATKTALNGKDDVNAILYTYADFKWKIQDLDLVEKSENKWEASFILDPEGALINCIFRSGELIDNGGALTYSWIINQAPGGYAGWGLMRNPEFNKDFPQTLDPSSTIEDQVSKMWINNEIRDHPDSRGRVFYDGLRLMIRTQEGDPTERIKQEVNYILSLPLDVVQQYDLQLSLKLLDQDQEKSFIDSVETVLVTKYPKGVLARDKEILRLFREGDLEKKTQDFQTFQQEFPSEKFEEVFTEIESLYYDKVYRSIAYTPVVKNQDFSFIFDNLGTARYAALMEYSWHFVSIPFDRETKSVDSLYPIAEKIMSEIERRENLIPKEYKRKLSPEQWRRKAIEMAAERYLTYTNILEATGLYKEEARFLEKIKPHFIYENSDFNELYTNQLLRKGNKEEAIDVISESLKRNNVSPVMLSLLKEDYLQKGGAASGFEEYVTSLKSKEAVAAHKEELLSQLINEPIEGFDLDVLGGGTLSLQEQKGKIVIIDMWATWCAPCKKAMPGMELAVNKYADDDKVQFFFLDTQEITPDYRTKVKEFIEEKGYPFTVLFDAENPDTGKLDAVYSNYSKAFKFSGIPQKMVIDQKGNLRWRSTGYQGSPSELADEFSIIIEHLKAEERS